MDVQDGVTAGPRRCVQRGGNGLLTNRTPPAPGKTVAENRRDGKRGNSTRFLATDDPASWRHDENHRCGHLDYVGRERPSVGRVLALIDARDLSGPVDEASIGTSVRE
jgi:hypothetical protein